MEVLDNNRHPPPEEIADYFGGRLALLREAELDFHFGWCDACAATARRIRLLSHIAGQWSAEGHRRAIEESRVVRALERAGASPACAQWRERLSHWAEVSAGKSEAALRVVFRKAGKAVEASVSGLTELTRPGALWPQFAPQAAMATRGAAEEAAAVVSTSADAPRFLVSAKEKDAAVEVDVEGVPSARSPLVMLVPHDLNGRLLLGELRPGALPGHFVARFEQVQVGEYTLVVEPLGAK
ncbi:MAG: hypothetical protein ACLP59_27905 [Bryobacteraceae bacterium]